MFINILNPDTLKFTKALDADSLPDNTYLGGGTAIALQIGHRKSLDLDFFTPVEFNENQWQQKFEQDLNFKLIQKDWQTLTGTAEGIKFSLFHYKYPLIEATTSIFNIKMASLEDLSAMKIDTAISRGTKRDFIDIYFLAQEFGLSKMFDFYNQKYGNFEERELMIKKSLVYFNDAEKDEDPDMLVPFDWGKLKEFFKKEVYV
jgi:hypothetical protein